MIEDTYTYKYVTEKIENEKKEKSTPIKIQPNINASLEEYLKQVREYEDKRSRTTSNYRLK